MAPLISVRGLTREFPAGDEVIRVLDGVDLDIEQGEMVAIIGASGSGKSTLMNILGCLDQPSSGSYRFNGTSVGDLGPDDLARLRRQHIGFIFQRYQLLTDLDAAGNVEIPAIYAGMPVSERRERAEELLTRLGLEHRMEHRPSQLSGGQQQRVGVARALMNGGEVILADEPTGALDSSSGRELMALLGQLHQAGHTIIIVTHDPKVAEQADRVIEISDGRIIADRRKDSATRSDTGPQMPRPRRGIGAALAQIADALTMAVRAMGARRLRTFLTMLGIIIGIASVVGVVAMGRGSQAEVLDNIASIGTDLITIQPGTGFGDRRSQRIETLVPGDAEALAVLDFVLGVSPGVSTTSSIRAGSVTANTQVQGVGVDYFDINGRRFVEGIGFSDSHITGRTQTVVLDVNSADTLFGNREAVGEVIIIGTVPMRVIGVVESMTNFGPRSQSLQVWTPYTTVMDRLTGQFHLASISLQVSPEIDPALAEARITEALLQRHRTQDFFLTNSNTIRDTISSTSRTMTVLVAMIAVLSLIVGGIGVMNIMLVSVKERTREIGVRMAVGARQRDIQRQFLIEAVLVCLLGGVAGIALAFGAGWLLETFANVRMEYSAESVAAAVAACTAIGIGFGYLPARSAARLDPVEALAAD